MKAKPPVLEIRDLFIRRDAPILQGVSWRVEAGRHCAILGPNGSGKTSLLAALTAYLTPSSGEIRLFGKRYGEHDWRELRKSVGLVGSALRAMLRFEEPALHAVLSGKEAMVNFWGESTDEERKRARVLLKQVGCGGLEERAWGLLSQGEQQRVLIARAFMARPKLLILDEPCAGLDMAAREHFLAFLEAWGRKVGAPTLVLVTHHVEEITPMFREVLILKAGRVLAAGPKEKALTAKHLSAAFGCPIRLKKARGRYAASVAPRAGCPV